MKLLYPLIILFAFSFAQYGKDFEAMSQTEKMIEYNLSKKDPTATVIFELLLPTSGYAYAGKWPRGLIVRIAQVPMSLLIGGGLVDMQIIEGGWSTLLGIVATSHILCSVDALNQTKKYNHNLYRDIFGKEPPSFSLNLQPTYQGANLTLAYKFD